MLVIQQAYRLRDKSWLLLKCSYMIPKILFSSIIADLEITTFNLLAPCYKSIKNTSSCSLNKKKLENEDENLWVRRALNTLNFMDNHIYPSSSIIALQEFWITNSKYFSLFQNSFFQEKYQLFLLKRPDSKQDGVATLIKRDIFDVLGTDSQFVCRENGRVALFLLLRHRITGTTFLVINTHLSFPHDINDRLQVLQIKRIISSVDKYLLKMNIFNCTSILIGDFNAEKFSAVYNHLEDSGYLSCSDSIIASKDTFLTSIPHDGICHNYDLTHGRGKYVTHRNHLQQEVGVDHIFIKQQQQQQQPSSLSFQVKSFEVLPATLCEGSWPVSFDLSDHRPVRTAVRITSSHCDI